jgi:hypothetical protein
MSGQNDINIELYSQSEVAGKLRVDYVEKIGLFMGEVYLLSSY